MKEFVTPILETASSTHWADNTRVTLGLRQRVHRPPEHAVHVGKNTTSACTASPAAKAHTRTAAPRERKAIIPRRESKVVMAGAAATRTYFLRDSSSAEEKA